MANDSNVTPFPFQRTIKPVPNNPEEEILFAICDGLPPARQKHLIIMIAEQGWVPPMAAQIVMSALGLEAL